MKNVPIGQILLENGFLVQNQLDSALEKQREMQAERPGIKLGDVLLELGYVSETQLAQALSIRLKVPFIDLTTTKIDIEAVKKIPEAIAKKNCCVAFQMSDSRLTVATDDPINFYIFEELKVISGMEIHAMLATRTAINETINKAYSQQTVSNVMDNLNREYTGEEMSAEDVESGERVDNAPIVKLVNTIVETSYRMDASDIHIEPFKDRTRIRLRCDGELVEQMNVKPAVHNSLITRIKILGGMNIAEKRIPLDGRFGMVIDGTQQDVRVSTIPTVYGEKCVIRLLATDSGEMRKVTELGMTMHNYEMFKQIIRCPHGVMLVTGPTGSGKSTTLYATLGELSKPNVNIVTVEDPCEKKIDGINQVQINAKAGMTFAAALRSILRQDPDIIMVGEIRDGETADIAIRAAITGHLVLSTLHTNDAAGTIIRLIDMGVAPYMVASSLVGIIAQRLVKLLCPDCKEKVLLTDPADLRLVGKTEPVEICQAHYGGCRTCHNSGYKGRTAIHEIIVTTNDIKELISKGATTEEIGAQAERNGTQLLRSNVTEMVLAGKTTMDELVKATYTV
ncbi:MAG: Flp pilus assembly complex ATPase component TadA [Ruminiclostridium sp.]|nr:Flp pilus assembly complex ATPase component TadA [Ruminiclostridium sp.]MBQ8931489.1 Flp pilus assembly complex ATPase component TadA [Ruminiclostridium sp.]